MKYNTVIFGAGYHGRLALRKCSDKSSNYKIICFVDNDKRKKNRFILKKKIIHINDISKLCFDKIIFCGRCIKEQTKQAKKFQIDKSKFVIWGRKELRPKKKDLKKRSRALLKMLTYVVRNFEKNKIYYWMDNSGLLALLRNQDLAEFSDVDIAIDCKDIKKIINIFIKKNKHFKFYSQFIYKSIYNKNKKFPKMHLVGILDNNKIEPPIIDFVSKNFKKKIVENIDTTSRIFPNYFWKEKENFNYKGITLNIPVKANKYLRLIYGNQWSKETEFWEDK